MHDVVVTDDKCFPVSRRTGDINNNNLLETTEKWIYSCQSNIQFSTTNIVRAEGEANGFTAIDEASATVLVSAAPVITTIPLTRIIPSFPNTGIIPENEDISWNITLLASILALVSLSFIIIYKNTQYNKEIIRD